MRVRVNSLRLVGADRHVEFGPGVNIIYGPVATGKTTLIRCIRGLLGSGLNDFPQEVRRNVTELAGDLLLGNEEFGVVRPFVTTRNAPVEIAGDQGAWRLPAIRGEDAEQSYREWLLERLDLPLIRVPEAPTKPESDLSPVTINDYLSYCHLKQDEIDSSVFGHDIHYKNVKRKAVFSIVYGKYNPEVAARHEQLRRVMNKLSGLKSRRAVIEDFLEDSPFANIAELRRAKAEYEEKLSELEKRSVSQSNELIAAADASDLREEEREIRSRIREVEEELASERQSVEELKKLLEQLEAQRNRLTRAIIGDKLLVDFDFIICPRCGADVDRERSKEGICYLCLQEPELELSRSELIDEQDQIGDQLSEAEELLDTRQDRIRELEESLEALRDKRERIVEELDYATESYVSDAASDIRSFAEQRATIQERIKKIGDYIEIAERRSDVRMKIKELESNKERLEDDIDQLTSGGAEFEKRVEFLENTLASLLERFQGPEFVEGGRTGIDRTTYLPIYSGRRFDELSSLGLQVLVNVAHVFAHQLTALEFNLDIPNIIVIDGLTKNIGHEGLDQERIDAIFDYVLEFGRKYGDSVQVIVGENTVPANASDKIVVRLSEDEKLIPSRLLDRGGGEEGG